MAVSRVCVLLGEGAVCVHVRAYGVRDRQTDWGRFSTSYLDSFWIQLPQVLHFNSLILNNI